MVASLAVTVSFAPLGVTVIVPAALSTAIVAQERVSGVTVQSPPSEFTATFTTKSSVASAAQTFDVWATERDGVVLSTGAER